MNRRNFLTSLVGGIAATAAVRTWPFRVYSFPSEIAVPPPPVSSVRQITGGPWTVEFGPLVGFWSKEWAGLTHLPVRIDSLPQCDSFYFSARKRDRLPPLVLFDGITSKIRLLYSNDPKPAA